MNLLIFNLKTDADDSVLGFTTDWINALARKCDRVVVVTMAAGRIAVAQNVTVHSVGKEKTYSEPRRLVQFYRILWHILRTERIDACFAHMMPLFAVLGWPLLKTRKIPIVLWYAHSHVSMLLRVATLLVDRVVASSPSGFRIATHKFQSIGQGIDVTRFRAREVPHENRGKLTLLTVGRIAPIKRLETVLHALPLLPQELRSRVVMRYVGEPVDEAGERYAKLLHQQARELGLSGCVRFEPALPFHNVQAAYANADIFINNSDTGSIDKTVLEAMSCGLPIITSNEAFTDLLGPELAASWCIPKNDPPVLAERIVWLARMTPQERHRLGLQLRDLIYEDHSLSALAAKVMEQVMNCVRAQCGQDGMRST